MVRLVRGVSVILASVAVLALALTPAAYADDPPGPDAGDEATNGLR